MNNIGGYYIQLNSNAQAWNRAYKVYRWDAANKEMLIGSTFTFGAAKRMIARDKRRPSRNSPRPYVTIIYREDL